jgi:maltose alpha-D-glucosyltransferase/alpha-amylase
VFFEEYGMLKIYRRLQPGPHPEIEMSSFLVERAGFANTPPLLATLELALDGESGPEMHALGVLFGFVRNQGDGWNQALNYLTRYLDDALLSTGDGRSDLADPDVFFVMLARQLGIRTAEMHRALAEHAGDDPDFIPEPISPEDIAEWRNDLAVAPRILPSASWRFAKSCSAKFAR